MRTYNYVTRLNKDPLSFIMDLSRAGSNEISGFVFGRIGLDPETQRPAIIQNGIYSQDKGGQIPNNILRLVEEQMAPRLNAAVIDIASQNSGKVEPPSGYTSVKKVKRIAMRAISDDEGNPEEKLYDDIGRVANGPFSFTGFSKRLL